MASNLRVDTILPSTGTSLGIGTASGTTTVTGNVSIGGNLGIGGTLTYEDVTNIDSVGVITARDGLRVTGVTTITGTGEYLLQLNKSDSSAVYTQFTNSTTGTSTSDGFRIGMDSNEDGLVWLREDGNVKFGTNNSERLRIDTSGNVTLNTGNLVIGTSGKGIDFSATSDASGMDSELLDDYEEGLFTPTVAGSSGSATVTYQGSDNRRGRYVKIGKMVHVNCLVGWNDVSNGFTGNIRVGGLPFAHENIEHADPNDYTQSVGACYFQNLTVPHGNNGHTVVYIWGGYSTYVNLIQAQNNGALAFVDINSGNNSSSSAIKYIQFSLSYPAA
jgi:hypothetical protein